LQVGKQRFVNSKWKKTLELLKSSTVRPYIPETAIFSIERLRFMLDRFGMVYVKPDKGTHGNGVMRVERQADGTYSYQRGVVSRQFRDFGAFYQDLSKATGGRAYLIQKGIHLLKHQGRRFDIRVMVQMSPKGRWVATGLIGRVAGPKRIVTNFHNGGQLKAVSVLMAGYMNKEERLRFERKLRLVGLAAAKRLEAAYPGIKEIGLDVGLDKALNPWIFEVNTCPDPYIFRKLKDKSIFKRIARYARAYGRIK